MTEPKYIKETLKRVTRFQSLLRNSNDPNLFHLYEVYKDEYSHKELHLNMPHFLKWQEEVLPMLDGDSSSVVMDTIFPDDQVWENQKNSLLKAE